MIGRQDVTKTVSGAVLKPSEPPATLKLLAPTRYWQVETEVGLGAVRAMEL
jgi:hypothetical protein